MLETSGQGRPSANSAKFICLSEGATVIYFISRDDKTTLTLCLTGGKAGAYFCLFGSAAQVLYIKELLADSKKFKVLLGTDRRPSTGSGGGACPPGQRRRRLLPEPT